MIVVTIMIGIPAPKVITKSLCMRYMTGKKITTVQASVFGMDASGLSITFFIDILRPISLDMQLPSRRKTLLPPLLLAVIPPMALHKS